MLIYLSTISMKSFMITLLFTNCAVCRFHRGNKCQYFEIQWAIFKIIWSGYTKIITMGCIVPMPPWYNSFNHLYSKWNFVNVRLFILTMIYVFCLFYFLNSYIWNYEWLQFDLQVPVLFNWWGQSFDLQFKVLWCDIISPNDGAFFTLNVCGQKIGCHIPSLLIQDWPQICILCISVYWWYPAYAWQIGPFWQDTLVLWNDSGNCYISLEVQRPTDIVNITAEFVLTSFYVIYGMKCAKYDICSERTGYKYI